MTTQPQLRRTARGSALMVTMVVTAIIGFSLASYLTLVSAQNRSVVRSQTWNSTIPIIEAGIEEALAHLNKNGLTNLFSQGWKNEYGYAVRKRWLGDCRYMVAITPTVRPVIECTAWAPAPILFGANAQTTTMFAQAGTAGWKNRTYVYRTVRVNTRGGPLFARGMVAKGSINLNGNNVSSDSFDSADPNFSTNGRYDRNKRNDNGDVATNSGGNVFDAGNANIMGRVATGPGGQITTGPNSSIGSKAWVLGGNTGIEPGHFTDDMNMDFPDVKAPFTSGKSPRYNVPISITNISYGMTTVTTPTLPSPPPAGPITTNYGTITTDVMPSPPPAGGVITTLVARTSTEYPTNAIGPVTTSTVVVAATVLPNPLPSNVVAVVSNVVTVTNVALPTNGAYVVLRTNTAPTTVAYPNSPMPDKNSDPGPWQPPYPGTYVGEVTRYYKNSTPKGWYQDYQAISSYVYQTYNYKITYSGAYSYMAYQYSFQVPQSYTYQIPTSTNVTITTTTYDMVFDSGDYVVANLSGSVYIVGDVRILVQNSMDFTGKSGITIGPKGSLKIYMAGSSAKIAGQGVLNLNGSAHAFGYYGLPSNTSLTIQGNGAFIGTIYAPQADFKLGGGGNDVQDFIGASVTATVFMNGHFNFHYDEDLARKGPQSLFVITSWNEIGPGENAILRNPDWVFVDDIE
jgi:hypothetical protein